MNRIIIENNRFDLEQTFTCGQCFRWNKASDGSFIGNAGGRLLIAKKEGKNEISITEVLRKDAAKNETESPDTKKTESKVINAAKTGIESFDEKKTETESPGIVKTEPPMHLTDFEGFVSDYFDLATDYEKIQGELAEADKTGVMAKAVSAGAGIRILRQDLWETILSFIISQNNNIPRIMKCIEKTAELFGDTLGVYEGKMQYTIPSAERLSVIQPSDLGPVRLGYRDRYIVESAKQYAMGDREIGKFTGVGPKVEACIRLFGMRDMQAFPIDVWVKRVMSKLYGFAENDTKGMQAFAKETFGEYAGLAQQYLFYYIRSIS